MKKIVKKNLKFEDLIYFAIFLLVIKASLYPSLYIKIPKILDIIIELFSYSLLGIYILNNKNNKKEFLIFTLLGLVVFVSSIFNNTFILLSSYLLFWAMFTLDKKKFVKIVSYTLLIVLVIHFLIFIIKYYSGSIPMVIDRNGRVRYGIGFNHPNVAGFLTTWCYLGFGFNNKKNKYIIFAYLIPVLIVSHFTDCRTMLIVCLLYTGLILIENKKRLNKIITKIPFALIIVVFIATLIAVLGYENGNTYSLVMDKITNQRIYYSYRALKIYGPTVFGRIVELRTSLYAVYAWDWLILDNLYMYCIYGYGIIHLLLLVIVSYFVSIQNDYKISIIMICWIIYSVSELSNMNFIISFGPLLGAKYVKRMEKKNDT